MAKPWSEVKLALDVAIKDAVEFVVDLERATEAEQKHLSNLERTIAELQPLTKKAVADARAKEIEELDERR